MEIKSKQKSEQQKQQNNKLTKQFLNFFFVFIFIVIESGKLLRSVTEVTSFNNTTKIQIKNI